MYVKKKKISLYISLLAHMCMCIHIVCIHTSNAMTLIVLSTILHTFIKLCHILPYTQKPVCSFIAPLGRTRRVSARVEGKRGWHIQMNGEEKTNEKERAKHPQPYTTVAYKYTTIFYYIYKQDERYEGKFFKFYNKCKSHTHTQRSWHRNSKETKIGIRYTYLSIISARCYKETLSTVGVGLKSALFSNDDDAFSGCGICFCCPHEKCKYCFVLFVLFLINNNKRSCCLCDLALRLTSAYCCVSNTHTQHTRKTATTPEQIWQLTRCVLLLWTVTSLWLNCMCILASSLAKCEWNHRDPLD